MLYVPTSGPESWKALLASPERHWRAGHSARELAQAWEAARGFPPPVEACLSTTFTDADLLLGIPEHRVPLPHGRASQNDLFVLARLDGRLATVMVEGKVREPFGETVEAWLRDASAGKRKRLAYIQSLLGLSGTDVAKLRYQLLHRTASAVIEAGRFGAPLAVMLVHSFSPDNRGWGDYDAAVATMGGQAALGSLARLSACNGVELYAGWVRDSGAHGGC